MTFAFNFSDSEAFNDGETQTKDSRHSTNEV